MLFMLIDEGLALQCSSVHIYSSIHITYSTFNKYGSVYLCLDSFLLVWKLVVDYH